MASQATPRVILGLMTYGPPSPDSRVDSLDEFGRHLDLFKSLGYHEIDTARIYMHGEQEKFTASAGWKERGLSVATKSYPLSPGMHKAENVRADLEASLKGLGTESVDIFYLHHPDRGTPFGETLAEVNKMYNERKFKTLGLSNYSALEIAEVVMLCLHNGWVRPKIYQGVYNVLNRNIETEIIPACRRYGLDVVIYNPLCGGLLTGKYKPDAESQEGRFSTSGFLGPIYRSMYFNGSNFKALELIGSAAKKYNLSMIEVALRWCAHHSKLKMSGKGNDGVVVGVSKLEQLEKNVSDLKKGPLPQEVVDALEQAWVVTKGVSPDPWHFPLVYSYDSQNVLFEDSK